MWKLYVYLQPDALLHYGLDAIIMEVRIFASLLRTHEGTCLVDCLTVSPFQNVKMGGFPQRMKLLGGLIFISALATLVLSKS